MFARTQPKEATTNELEKGRRKTQRKQQPNQKIKRKEFVGTMKERSDFVAMN